MQLLRLSFVALWLFAFHQLAIAAETPLSFEQTLQQHLRAITDRDLDALLPTVADDLDVIFPNGQLIHGKAEYHKIHTQWFADDQWRMEFEEIRRSVSAEMATVLLRYELRDVPEPGQGNPRSAYLALVFQLIDGHWLLVHDQNTRIQPPPAE